MPLRFSQDSFARALCGFLGSAMLASMLNGQATTGASNATIRSETRMVLVDAVAIDKKNNFARDLTQKDFKVWEDGKEQKITSFSLESAGVSPERSNKHYIALFYDSYTVTPASQQRVRQETIRFVDGFASPDRYMAVINYYGAGLQLTQNFTADAERVKGALGTLQGSTAGATANGTGRVATAGETLTHTNFLASIGSVAKSLAAIRGRKALMLFSAGFDMTPDISDELAKTIDACNRANVGVYSVPVGSGSGASATSASSPLPGGITPGGGGGRGANAAPAADEAASNENVLRSLSDGTGGMWMPPVTNDLASALGKIAQEQDQYYLLGYTPAVESAEGTCHKLRVKVDRSSLDVRAREGYCTSRPADSLSGKPASKELETRAANGAPGNIAAKMQLPWFYSRPNVALVDIAMDIDPSAMKFQKEKGKIHVEIELAAIAYKPDGSSPTRVGDTVKLDFDTQQQADAFLKTPYHYTNQFEIAPGDYNFRMLFSLGDRGFGKVEMPLKIELWNGQELSLSGLALSHDAHPATGLAAGLDESLLEGPRPLVAKGMEVTPTGTNEFRAGERSFLYFEVYEPRLVSAPADVLRLRILDRATGQQKVDSGPVSTASLIRPGNPLIPVAMALPATNLPAGAYKVEVSVARGNGQDAVVRSADFDVK